jgi:homocysteine S-methyltransferase
MLLVDAFARTHDLGARVVGVNCLNGPDAMVQLLRGLPAGDLLSAYANAGYPKYTEGSYLYPTAPDHLASAARDMAAEGARLIGGCCGTTPAHVAAIAAAIADLRPVRSKRRRVSEVAESAPPKLEAPAEENLLDRGS